MRFDNSESLRESVQVADSGDGQNKQGPREVYPVGMFDKQPETDDPVYYQTSMAKDGKTVTVGPFDLTAQQIHDWAHNKSANDLDEMVSHGQLKPSTALTLKSAQFESMINLIDSGQQLPPNMIQRFVPGDLQRAVHGHLLEARTREK